MRDGRMAGNVFSIRHAWTPEGQPRDMSATGYLGGDGLGSRSQGKESSLRWTCPLSLTTHPQGLSSLRETDAGTSSGVETQHGLTRIPQESPAGLSSASVHFRPCPSRASSEVTTCFCRSSAEAPPDEVTGRRAGLYRVTGIAWSPPEPLHDPEAPGLCPKVRDAFAK